MRKILLTIMTISYAFVAAFCSGNTKNNNREAQELSGAGATFPLPFYNVVFEEFATVKGDAVAYGGIGSGTTFVFTDYLTKVSPMWKEKFGAGKSVNFPSGQARRISSKSMFMYLGELVEYGDTETMFTNPADERTKAYLTGKMG